MWNRIVIMLATCLLANCVHGGEDSHQSLRLVSYNIRLDTPEDGDNAWQYRKNDIVAFFRFYAPDIVGMQEVLPNQLADLKKALSQYEYVGIGRDGKPDGAEWSPIGFRSDRIFLVESGVFWLSTTPSVPSIGWDAAFPRTATWARLADRRTSRSTLIINTHWDHKGKVAREESAQQIKSWITEHKIACEPVFLLGDLNATSSDQAYRMLVTSTGDETLTNSIMVAQTPAFGPKGTFNGFDLRSFHADAIDHIFFNGDVVVVRHGVITQHTDGRLPSDHYPVLVDTIDVSCQQHSTHDDY